jgi:hypothetical protein
MSIPNFAVRKFSNQLLTFVLSAIPVLIPILVYTWLIMGPYAANFEMKNTRAVLFIFASMVGVLFIYGRNPGPGWIAAFAFVLVLYTTLYKVATYLPEISNLPWSLGWSEGSRFYNASLFFSERIYGIPLPLPVLHPSRYLMQAVAFLIPDLPLWFHRIWQVFLWLSMSLLAGFVLARRFGSGWGFALFCLLFMFQGPVYYHLLVMVILVVWGFDSQHIGRSMLVVLLASIWAGISRINWFPVPGLIASAIYFMEKPVHSKTLWRYLLPAVTWPLAGTLVAYFTQSAYMSLSGNPAGQFSSSFSSDLLWYRLWPNATYPLGIFRGVWRVSFPMLLILLARWLPNWRRYHWIRLFGLAGIIFVLLTGGIIVSVKIGGGSNLHNMDAYLVVLLLIGAGFYFNKVIPENPAPLRAQGMLWPLVFFVLFIPLRDLSQIGGALPKHDLIAAHSELAVLSERAQAVAKSGGEVLFVSQRQLLATQMIEGVPLIADYEVVFLMEMAMGNNTAYLSKYYDDLSSHRFDLIVAGSLNPNYQDQTFAFSEENNVWVDRVTLPLLCYYQSELDLADSGVSLLIPREDPCE